MPKLYQDHLLLVQVLAMSVISISPRTFAESEQTRLLKMIEDSENCQDDLNIPPKEFLSTCTSNLSCCSSESV